MATYLVKYFLTLQKRQNYPKNAVWRRMLIAAELPVARASTQKLSFFWRVMP
jgi:hypothetical protein